MLVIWKGRGLLTALYLVLSIALMAILTVFMEDWLGGVFIQDNTILFAMALAFILAGLMTYYTSLTHVKKNGVKVRVKSHHSLFFIPMAAWSIMMYTFGGILFAAAVYSLHTRGIC